MKVFRKSRGASPFWPKRHLDDGWWRLFFKGVTFQNYDTNWTFGKNRPKGDAFNEFRPTLVFLWEHQLFGFISFLNFFLQKRENVVFTLVYPMLSDFPKISILHYNTRFSWIFWKKSKVATLGFFQKMTKIKFWVLVG